MSQPPPLPLSLHPSTAEGALRATGLFLAFVQMLIFTNCCDDFVTSEVRVGQSPWALVCTGAGGSSGDRPQMDKVHDVIDVPLCCHRDFCVKNTN